jgi:hypothetical protein
MPGCQPWQFTVGGIRMREDVGRSWLFMDGPMLPPGRKRYQIGHEGRSCCFVVQCQHQDDNLKVVPVS